MRADVAHFQRPTGQKFILDVRVPFVGQRNGEILVRGYVGVGTLAAGAFDYGGTIPRYDPARHEPEIAGTGGNHSSGSSPRILQGRSGRPACGRSKERVRATKVAGILARDQVIEIPGAAAKDQLVAGGWLPGEPDPGRKIVQGGGFPRVVGSIVLVNARRNHRSVVAGHDVANQTLSRARRRADRAARDN